MCCDKECTGVFNGLQAFPFVAWEDIRGGKLDPETVTRLRKAAEMKPFWKTIPRHVATNNGLEIIKSRLIDVNRGEDEPRAP